MTSRPHINYARRKGNKGREEVRKIKEGRKEGKKSEGRKGGKKEGNKVKEGRKEGRKEKK